MTLHAVLTLNLCFESYGAAVHLMDSLLGSAVFISPRNDHGSATPVTDVAPVASGAPVTDAAIAASVRDAIGSMPFDQAHALWLIDVCGCSYDQAAAETSVTRQVVARRVGDGRRFIRAGITTCPARTTNH